MLTTELLPASFVPHHGEERHHMFCAQCQTDNKPGRKFCAGCGASFPLACDRCGFANDGADRFCGGCGAPLASQAHPGVNLQALIGGAQSTGNFAPAPLTERLRTEPEELTARGETTDERKTITALFADLKGSTALIEGLDPEEARALIDPALQLMMDAVHRYDGSVAQVLGDGIFALFGAPIAHEDHPQRALHAALRMQEEMRRHVETLRARGFPPLLMRVGVNTGEVVLRSIRKDEQHSDYVPVGHATNLAARMEQLAVPGSILVTAATHKLTDGYFAFKALGKTQVKGMEEPLAIYEVQGVGSLQTRLQVAARRGLARFVGRRRELDHLHHALTQAKAAQGQIVGVMGEAGVGKSRLFHEFTQLFVNDCVVLEAHAVSHGKATAYLPVIELLKSYFDIHADDEERKRREKVGGKVLMLDRGLEHTLPYLLALLGLEEPLSPLRQMDPRIRRQRTLAALKQVFVRESLNQPLILILEDLHWIDAETQEFLDTLSEGIASSHILLLVNYRPEYRSEWGQKTYYTQVRLDSFTTAEAEEFLAALLGSSPLPPGERGNNTPLNDLQRLILDKTQGTPFFIEEVVQTLAEEGVLSGEREHYQLARRTPSMRIPPTVQGILAARIDRLAPEEKVLLQQLAVVGRKFPLGLVKQVVPRSEEELARLLGSLQRKEFLYEHLALPEIEYRFKHALTHEVAYGTVPRTRRQELHARTARALESFYADKVEDHYGELAHHYRHGGNLDHAIASLHKAGHHAARHAAHTEAIRHWTAALELLPALPDTPERQQRELTLQLTLAASLQVTKGPSAPEVGSAYTRARELCQQQGETRQLFVALHGLWLFHHVQADLLAARAAGEQLLTMAEGMQDSALLVEARRALGSTVLWQGDFPLARRHLEQAVTLYEQQPSGSVPLLFGGADPGVVCLCELARVLWLLGYPDQALRRSHTALLHARTRAEPFSLGFALIFAAGLSQLRREGARTQQHAEEGMTLAQQYGFAALLSAGTIRRGWALAEQGHEEEGLRDMRQGLAARQEAGAELAHPYFLALQAEVYGKVGQGERARTLLAQALTTAPASKEHRLEAELYRLKGELTLQESAVSLGQVATTSQTGPKPVENKPEIPDSRPLNPDLQGEAETCFFTAIDIARAQHAKSLELRATMGLARLWRQHGKHAEARRMLAAIYDWFTEGFETKDLQEAKALLQELI
jgi:class 3 adenylate cyclase/predicted ATPase